MDGNQRTAPGWGFRAWKGSLPEQYLWLKFQPGLSDSFKCSYKCCDWLGDELMDSLATPITENGYNGSLLRLNY